MLSQFLFTAKTYLEPSSASSVLLAVFTLYVLPAPVAFRVCGPTFTFCSVRESHSAGQKGVQNDPCTELQLLLRPRTAFHVVRGPGCCVSCYLFLRRQVKKLSQSWETFTEISLTLCLLNPMKSWACALYVFAFFFKSGRHLNDTLSRCSPL